MSGSQEYICGEQREGWGERKEKSESSSSLENNIPTTANIPIIFNNLNNIIRYVSLINYSQGQVHDIE